MFISGPAKTESMPTNNNDLQSKIRANVKSLRISKGMTVIELAHVLGISTQYLYMLQAGRKPFNNVALLEKIAAYFKVEPQSLLS